MKGLKCCNMLPVKLFLSLFCNVYNRESSNFRIPSQYCTWFNCACILKNKECAEINYRKWLDIQNTQPLLYNFVLNANIFWKNEEWAGKNYREVSDLSSNLTKESKQGRQILILKSSIWQKQTNHCLVSQVGKVPVYRAGGSGLIPSQTNTQDLKMWRHTGKRTLTPIRYNG